MAECKPGLWQLATIVKQDSRALSMKLDYLLHRAIALPYLT